MPLYAVDVNGRKIRAAPGLRGGCQCCGSSLQAKCGRINIWHWAHLAGDCDPWHEPESAWHLKWKECAPDDWCEVAMGPHRADIRRDDGLVIELQHSLISAEEIEEREKFYDKMVWLFDATKWFCGVPVYTFDDGVEWMVNRSRPTLAHVTKPLYLDLGINIIEVGRFGGPCRILHKFHGMGEGLQRVGVGRKLARQEFLNRMGLRPPVAGCSAVEGGVAAFVKQCGVPDCRGLWFHFASRGEAEKWIQSRRDDGIVCEIELSYLNGHRETII